uniref:Uncharacterized protein n=1 Tax=Branchiostoma floridae TaxID=7739 RepID=C3YPI2_BRAFL|eukprot:XP_002601754.1 hypothetical protein BRAFLDRAFT_76026 [Branchiostoma floridae]
MTAEVSRTRAGLGGTDPGERPKKPRNFLQPRGPITTLNRVYMTAEVGRTRAGLGGTDPGERPKKPRNFLQPRGPITTLNRLRHVPPQYPHQGDDVRSSVQRACGMSVTRHDCPWRWQSGTSRLL